MEIREYVTKMSYLVFTILGRSDKMKTAGGNGLFRVGEGKRSVPSLQHVITETGGYKHGKKDEVHGR